MDSGGHMQPIWQALFNLIRGRGSGGPDATIAVTVAAFAFIGVFTLAYILMKFFSLPDERATAVKQDAHGAIASPPQSATAHAPETRQEFVRALERTRPPLLKIYRTIMWVVVGVFVLGGIHFYMIATPGNELILVSLISFGVAFAIWARMSQFMKDEEELHSIVPGAQATDESKDASLWGVPLKISKTFSAGEPTVVKIESDAIKTASELLRGGSDMDMVCRQINPQYANWGSLQKRLFRKTMEMVLKAEAASGH